MDEWWWNCTRLSYDALAVTGYEFIPQIGIPGELLLLTFDFVCDAAGRMFFATGNG